MDRLGPRVRGYLCGLVFLACGPGSVFLLAGTAEGQAPEPPAAAAQGKTEEEKTTPKKKEDEEEIRIQAAPLASRPDASDKPGEDNLVDKLMRSAHLQMVLESHREEWAPFFQSERTERGVRVTCNHRGNRYSYEIVGEKIREGDPRNTQWIVDGRLSRLPYEYRVCRFNRPDTNWIVDGRLLRVQALPLTDGERADESRLLRELTEHLTGKGWQVVSDSRKQFQFPRGEKAEYVELVPGKDVSEPTVAKWQVIKAQLALTLNRRNILMIACLVPKDEDERKCAEMVRQTMLSLRRLPDLPQEKAPLTADDLMVRGTTLKELLFMNESMFRNEWGAFVNDKFARLRDRRLPRVAVLKPQELMRHLRLYMLAGQGELALAPRPGRRPQMVSLQTTVYDEATAHAIVLEFYDRAAGRYVYWEPWAKDTFLGRGNNRAGIAARETSNRKFFSVTEAELTKVLYTLSAPWEELEPDHRLLELLDEPEARAVEALKKKHENDPQNHQTSEQRLLTLGQFLLLEEKPRKAAVTFRACRTLHPKSIRALVGAADALRAAGDRDGAAALYRQARTELAEDKKLSSSDKEALEKHIQDGLSTPGPGAPQPDRGR